MRTPHEIDSAACDYAAIVAFSSAYPYDITVGRNQVAIEGEFVRLGDFRKNLDEPRYNASVITEVLMPRQNDLGQIHRRIDIGMIAVDISLAPTRSARVARKSQQKD